MSPLAQKYAQRDFLFTTGLREKVNRREFKDAVLIKRFSITITLVICSLFPSCKDNGTGPANPPTGKRNYTWTVDTLAYPGSYQTLMRAIGASSAKDVYVGGHNDQSGWGTMYHYDGTNWKDVKLHWIQGGPIRHGFDLNSIYGFSPSDIYAAGYILNYDPISQKFSDSSLIIHYNGNTWQDIPIEREELLKEISGSSPQNVWSVGGGKYSIYHYTGSSWTRDSVRWSGSTAGDFWIYSIAVISDNEFYALGSTHINELAKDVYYFFHVENDNWLLVDSAVVEPGRIENKWGYSKLWISPWGSLYSVGGGLYKWDQHQWVQMFNSDVRLNRIYGLRANDIFVVGDLGTVYHYNGTDWYQYTKYPPTSMSPTLELFCDVWTDGNEVFIVGQDPNTMNTIILHGR